MRKLILLVLAFTAYAGTLLAQKADEKKFPPDYKCGDALLLNSYGEFKNVTTKVFIIQIYSGGEYLLYTLANLKANYSYKVVVDDVTAGWITASVSGWQDVKLTKTLSLAAGKHVITFVGVDPLVPMFEEIRLSKSLARTGSSDTPPQVMAFLEAAKQRQHIETSNRVLANPEGTYNHAIDTSYQYSHYSSVYLAAGTHEFRTVNSTGPRSLVVFNPANFIQSFANYNQLPNGESQVFVTVASPTYVSVMLRPISNNASGYSDIVLDGNIIVTDAVYAGKTYAMSSLKGGDLNFFTCKLTAGGDTRMIASRYATSSARGYNDDYTGGTWSWGLASRIRKNFDGSDSVQYAYVCAFSPSTTGVCDIYMGNENSNVNSTNFPEFPSLNATDAIKAAPSTGMYNCISWSGGVTSTWIWPPSQYSTYNCSGSYTDVTCFDNFYGNTPARYPGAMTYSRTGATSANSIVDLWALNGNYTHGSVRKTGNNHPHGYDWESKPGGTARTFHPRSALTNLNGGYGSITNYYKPTGTFARNANAVKTFDTDEEAVKAGIAIFDRASLTAVASNKLNELLRKNAATGKSDFEQLYEAWKSTWAANEIYSDPAAYCKNIQYENLRQFAIRQPRAAMLMSFEKFVGGDHLIGELIWTLTKERYAYLLDEVKAERKAKPNDEAGRYRIHGDHDNGVLYIEKVLRVLPLDETLSQPEAISVQVSPNPVKDILKIQFNTTRSAMIGVKVISGQSLGTFVLQADRMMGAGMQTFTFDISRINTKTGDMLAIQVTIDGVTTTTKVLVAK